MTDSRARQLLVDMLHEAAELEHCLLNAYLYAAGSLKSTPQEFAAIAGRENRRRAPQFERARRWKASVLEVSHEEMRHLHYVQCLIRALGERPYLGLPERGENGIWKIPNWRIRIGEEPVGDDGTEIPVLPFGTEAIRNFILYESTDALQDEDPFGAEALDLYRRLYAFEFALWLEGMLVDMPNSTPEQKDRKEDLKRRLSELYQRLEPIEERLAAEISVSAAEVALPPLEKLRFQSIGDFYNNGILPLYEMAYEQGWVVVTDRNLLDEQRNPDYAAQGFLPVGPIGRSARFARHVKGVNRSPLTDYKRVEDIVDEIVSEGEGAALFSQRAEDMLSKVEEIGLSGFLQALKTDAAGGPGYATPDWLNEAQLVRKSHLYVFAMMFVEHEQECLLAEESGVEFEAARSPIAASNAALKNIAAEIPLQFNAAYLGMLAWLARMYETQNWASDKPRRMAIEMVATWPLMSLAIRPMLELASFFPIDRDALFRYDSDHLPMLPIWAQQLADVYESPERSEKINAEMDRLIVRTLRGVADWAREQLWAIDGMVPEPECSMIRRRFVALGKLEEFEKQFPFRVAGGYSDRLPDLTYQATHTDADGVSEAPDLVPLFAETLVLRLRFCGRGLVQLATDPDPPSDEVGVTGTHMFHAADGDLAFDRALVWQDFEADKNIHRSAPGVGPVGVNCVEAALLAPDRFSGAFAGYVPLHTMNSSGAVQASGVQQKLAVQNLHEVHLLDTAVLQTELGALRVFLETKGGERPLLFGENHLVWQDGEPVDPFVFSIYGDGEGQEHSRLLGREIYNRGKSMAEMEPYERLRSSRGPVGFDRYTSVPEWAQTDEFKRMTAGPNYPVSFLTSRSRDLAEELASAAEARSWTRESVDTAISLAERLVRVAQPRGTTLAWPQFLLHYGHTLSGAHLEAGVGRLLDAVGSSAEIGLLPYPEEQNRDAPNGRWLVSYTKGLMDTDTLSDFVYGELYVPVSVRAGSARFERSWRFPSSVADAVRGFACDFAKPFWAEFKVSGNKRETSVTGIDASDLGKAFVFVETLEPSEPPGYCYTLTGFPGISNYGGRFSLEVGGELAILTWNCSFVGEDASVSARCLSLLSSTADQMGAVLSKHFGPAAA